MFWILNTLFCISTYKHLYRNLYEILRISHLFYPLQFFFWKQMSLEEIILRRKLPFMDICPEVFIQTVTPLLTKS